VAIIATLIRMKSRVDREKAAFLKSIEEKWQKKWLENKVFEANPDERKKFFITFPYPYVNAYPHLGSAYTVLRVDIVARYKRMKGFNVLFPQGWHATGGPIVAAALRVREGDPKQIKILKSMNIAEEEIPKFRNPEYWVKFFVKEWKKDFQRYGLSIDWRREFHTTYLNPPYNKFIQWQYTKLREKGLITKGRHPVVWCPKEQKVVGDHDRPDEYAGIGPEEVVIIKFRGDDGLIYPCMTYRPETVYGAVNIWINPKAEYYIAEVDGEKWVIGNYGIEEFKDQGHKVKVLEKIKGEKLLGKYVENPVTGWKVPVLPALFVDPEIGTGVVMSVPAHAPYDYAALKDLKTGADIVKDFKVDREIVENVKPVSLIKLEGYGEFPAIEEVEKLRVSNQLDREKLDKATREIYSKEFYKGILKEMFGKWAGKTVEQVKEEIIRDLVSKGVALRHYTLPTPVYCRCGAKTHVKIVEDQWFLRYSDQEWKKKAHQCIDTMTFLPPGLKEYFHKQVDWYQDWACTHKGELGTPLPWDPDWVLESLSDSTIYMAYYTISKYLQHPDKYGIDWNKLNNSFFDYIFLGKGNVDEVSEQTGISKEVLEEMRREFLYWYPVDMRISGKDLLQNHLVFFIMHHVAIFPRDKWPRGIGINGWIMIEGRKMSKSLGNFILLRDALDWWGADATRFAEAYAGNAGLDDGNFEITMADNAVELLYNWYRLAVENYGKGREEKKKIDEWFESVLNRTIIEVEKEMEATNFKNALVKGFFDLQNKFKWYYRRCEGNPNRELLKKFIEIQTLILAPITPHIAEEIWEKIGKKGFISLAPWPKAEEDKINLEIEKAEEVIVTLIEDIKGILRIIKGTPKKAKIIVAAEWKYPFFEKVSRKISSGTPVREAIRESMKELTREEKREIGRIMERIVKDPTPLTLMVSRDLELEALKEAKEFIEREVKLEIEILTEEEEKPKAKIPIPAKPAIIIV